MDRTLSAPGRLPTWAPLVFVSAFLLLAVYWVGRQISVENYRSLVITSVALQGFWILFRWRTSVYLFMIFVVIEGFLINYFHSVPELNLMKDALALALFSTLATTLVMRRESTIFPRTLWVPPYLAFASFYALQIFNPELPTVLVGLVGLRSTLLFCVLAPVAYWFFESRERILEFFEFMVWLSVPVSLYALIQLWLGPSWVISLSPGFSRAVFFAVGSGGRITQTSYFRTFSTFVHTGGCALFLSLTLMMTVALWMVWKWKNRRLLLIGLFIVQFSALLSTGARGAFVILALSITVLLFTNPISRRVAPLILLIPAIFYGSSFLLGSGVKDRYETVLDFDYLVQRNTPLVTGWLSEAMSTEWTGSGAGYASVASRYVAATPLNGNTVENTLAKIRFEAGLPGLVLYVFFVGAVILECLVTPHRIRDPQLRWLTTVCAIYVIFNTGLVIAGTPFDVSPTNTLIWFLLGLMARAKNLDDSVELPGLSHS